MVYNSLTTDNPVCGILKLIGEIAMNAKTKTAMAADAIIPTSIKDAAYKFARAGETSASIARYIVDNDPSFPDEVSKELKADLNAGFMLRATELWGDEFYKLGDGGTYIPMGNSIVLKNVAPEKSIRIGLSYCFAMSQQEFGQLKNKDPQLHGIVKPMRDKFSKYSHNNIAALKLAARALLNDGKSRERGATKNFTEALTDMFESFDKRVKNAEARNDETASPVQFRVARDAFWNAYSKK
jgi:hypothetical protein